MSLRPKSDRYSSDKESAQASTRYQINFMKQNLKYLRRVDKKGGYEKFIVELGPAEGLLSWQISKVEKVFELVWKGYDMPSVNEHVDRKPKGLKY